MLYTVRCSLGLVVGDFFFDLATIVLLFVFDNYYLIMNLRGLKNRLVNYK